MTQLIDRSKLHENHACMAVMDFQRIRRNLCLPRYTPANWWECDVFELTAKDFAREYEVKLTLADFNHDADKCRTLWTGYGNPRVEEKKHDLLAKGDPRGPSQFWFVTPEEMITSTSIPSWAGWMVLTDRGASHRPTHRWSIHERVKAPKLHGEKAPQKTRQQMFATCYYRFHDAMRCNIDRMEIPHQWNDAQPVPFAEQLEMAPP